MSTYATSEESSAAGSPDEDLIRRSVAAFNAGDIEGYLAGFSPDAPRWVSGLQTPLTLDDIRANVILLTEAFDRLHLDEDLLFYLRARGIPANEAEALLIQAFVGEAIEGIEHAGLRDALMDHVVAWLAMRK